MKIFVTGGSGFLGRHLVPLLTAAGHHVEAPASSEIDLTDADAVDALGAGGFDWIFHLAAWTRAGRFCRERGGDQWIVNERINVNLVDWWRRLQPQAKLIAFGTTAAYAGEGVHLEDDYLAGEPDPDYRSYAYTKRMLLVGMSSMQQQFGLKWLYLVPPTLYGPDYHTDGRELHSVYDIARKLIVARDSGGTADLWGDGSERRDLLHVRDAARFAAELGARATNTVVNLGGGENWTIREIADTMSELAGLPSERLRFGGTPRVGARAKTLDAARLEALLGPHPWAVDLRTGLAETLAWVERNLPCLSSANRW